MTRKLLLVCDGCDAEVLQLENEGWVTARIKVETERSSGYTVIDDSHAYDLCKSCALRVNPTFWPRAIKEVPAA